MSPAGEFAYIDRIRARLPPLPAGWVGPGDDGAVLDDGLVVVTDTVVDGVHLRLGWCTPADAGWKALAVNVSDLAAMGATPTAAVCAATLPPDPPAGLADGVADGLLAAAAELGCPLVGGDVTSGPVLVLTVTALGHLDGPPVLRGGARPGDTVLVTGPLGGPAAAVAALTDGRSDHPGTARLHRPQPRVAAGGVARRAGATAMIDVSDGLAADLGHVCDESGVGVEVEATAVPVAEGADLAQALSGGDDYELAVCTPDAAALVGAFSAAGLPEPVAVGRITAGPDRVVVGRDGRRPLVGGWSHAVD